MRYQMILLPSSNTAKDCWGKKIGEANSCADLEKCKLELFPDQPFFVRDTLRQKDISAEEYEAILRVIYCAL